MKRRLISRNFVLFSLLLSVILAFGPGLSSTFAAPFGKPEVVKLSVGLAVPVLSFLPVYVAEEKGFLKNEGLTDVKVLAFRGDADVIQALAGGTIDINVASLTGLVNSISAGQRFKAFWGGYNMGYLEWFGSPKYKTIADTKGARYGVTRYGALTDSLTRYVLRNAGLDPDKDVKILQTGVGTAGISAMEAGQIDVVVISPAETYIAAEKGFVPIIRQRTAIASDWPTHVVYAKEDFIAKNPNTIKAFLTAQGKAMEWIKANPDEAAAIANKAVKVKLEYCRRAIDDVRNDWLPDGRLPQGMDVFWKISVQAGDVKEAWPESKWLDPTFLKTQNEWRK